MAFIEARLGEVLSITLLAQEAGLSPHHFTHSFKESFGLSPHRFVQQRRMEKALKIAMVEPLVPFKTRRGDHLFPSDVFGCDHAFGSLRTGADDAETGLFEPAAQVGVL